MKTMAIEKIAYELAEKFRSKYDLGNYCGKNIIDIIEKFSLDCEKSLKLIRKPFDNERLAGFIAYKYDMFIIVTNTNKTLGNERFTIAHEIYHLLENTSEIIEKRLLEEIDQPSGENEGDSKEKLANNFAIELLMPAADVKKQFMRLTQERNGRIDHALVINLQQMYGVDYIAMVRRLKEVNLKLDKGTINRFESLAENKEELEKTTLMLGFDNTVNIASRAHYISNQYLDMIKTNYDNKLISFDDLIRIFNYLGVEPERFGYEKYNKLSADAEKFMDNL